MRQEVQDRRLVVLHRPLVAVVKTLTRGPEVLRHMLWKSWRSWMEEPFCREQDGRQVKFPCRVGVLVEPRSTASSTEDDERQDDPPPEELMQVPSWLPLSSSCHDSRRFLEQRICSI